jgi:hypothetical protein
MSHKYKFTTCGFIFTERLPLSDPADYLDFAHKTWDHGDGYLPDSRPDGASDSARQTSVVTYDTLKKRLNYLHGIDKVSYRKIALLDEFYGVPAGTLCDMAKGKEPRSPHLRARLGLPALVSLPPCPKCGEVHLAKTCPAARKKAARMKHICDNCFNWLDRRIEYPTREEGYCKSGDVMNATGCDDHLYPDHDFGCRFWQRKEGAE